MANVLATRYARALLDLSSAQPEEVRTKVQRDLETFRDVYADSKELRQALASPAVAIAQRQRVITTLVERLGLHDLVRRFLLVVNDHGRLPLLKEIVAAYEELVDEQAGRATANVKVATEPTAEQRAILEQRLAQITGRQVRARFSVDPALLGGFRAEIGSTVYDASVRGQLDAIRHRIQPVA